MDTGPKFWTKSLNLNLVLNQIVVTRIKRWF